MHLIATPSLSRTTSLPQTGHFEGIFQSSESEGLSDNIGPTTSGIISPAL